MTYVEDVARQISAKLAERLNIPEPPEAWRAFAAQVRNETAGGDPSTRGVRNNNPLNLTDANGQIAWGGQVASDGPFAVFSSTDAGVDAAVQNLLAPDYERVRNSFRFGDPVALVHSIEASPWDAGHYSNNLASMLPDSGTYIGGGSSVTGDPECPIGYHWDGQSCASWVPGGIVPNVPPGKTLPTAKSDEINKAFSDTIGKAVGDAVNNATGPIGSAISGIGDRALKGTQQLLVAGVIVATIAVLSYAGVRRTVE